MKDDEGDGSTGSATIERSMAPPSMETLQATCAALPGTKRLGDRECEVIYAQGWQLFQRGLFAQAAEVFAVLALYRPLSPRYLNAHAMCRKLMHQYDMAVLLFVAVLTVDEDDPVPAMHLAQCLFAIGQDAVGFDALRLVIVRAGNAVEHAELAGLARQWLAGQGESNA
ncbi:MAG: hypothetical protein ACRYGK_03645 [Janthinobacterium lividum]